MLFLQRLRRALRHAAWETCLTVEYCHLCIVDQKTEAHVTYIEIVVACFARGGSSCLQNIPLPTQCPNPNPHVPKPKPHQMQSPQT